MPGLLSQGMGQQAPQQSAPQQPPQGQPAQQPQGQQQPQQGDPRTDPDQELGQQQYDALVQAMLNYLYGPGAKQVEAALSHGDKIIERMANVISTIMLTIQHSLSAEGKTVPPKVMFQAGMELSKAVGEIAQEMGRLPKQGGGDSIEAAFLAALGRFGQLMQEGSMTDQQRQRYAEMIRTVKQLKQRAVGQQSAGQGQQPQQQPQQAPSQPPPAAQQPAPAQKPARGM